MFLAANSEAGEQSPASFFSGSHSRVENRFCYLMEGNPMKNWFKFETREVEYSEDVSQEGMLLYLKPEALKHALVVDDFESFQSHPDFVEGGRLLQVSRQFSYTLRTVADLVEEPLEQKSQAKPKEPVAENGTVLPDKPLVTDGDQASLEELEAMLAR
jgi:hypothetical protein|tara:strand:- start:73 stop:546 length:474 start_codon:yes stop_codon:yes gene_type:complete